MVPEHPSTDPRDFSAASEIGVIVHDAPTFDDLHLPAIVKEPPRKA